MIEAPAEDPLVRIHSEVTRRVRQHARAHMQTEVCGVLIGRLCDGIIAIEAPIEAFNAAQAGAHVTFTQAAWETIYRVKDKQYPADRIVGWYHSHPGFGVFLSDHDTFIHRNFFSSPDQVAWVYDPHSDEEGCFGWVGDSIHRLTSIHVADNNAEAGLREGDRLPASGRTPQAESAPPPIAARQASLPQTPRTSVTLVARLAAFWRRAWARWSHLGRSFFSFLAKPGLADTPAPAFETNRGHATETLPPESRP